MSTTSFEVGPYQLPLATLQSLLAEDSRDGAPERRREPRFNFFAPARLIGFDGESLRAFTREISRTGVGIVLERALHRGTQYKLQFPESTVPFEVIAEVVWNREIADGWVLAGFRFVDSLK
ncbi:MAG: PilZ domain-containing protein [Planctomycetaceae bacterium]|nr:PilZ domain-containing protein [Planctomycetaceae bacterium]